MKLTHYPMYTLKIHKSLNNGPISKNNIIFRKEMIYIFQIYNQKLPQILPKGQKRASIPKSRRN